MDGSDWLDVFKEHHDTLPVLEYFIFEDLKTTKDTEDIFNNIKEFFEIRNYTNQDLFTVVGKRKSPFFLF